MDVLARSTTERRDPPVRRQIRSDRSVRVSPIILVRIEGVTTAFLLLALGPRLGTDLHKSCSRDGRREPTEIRLHPGQGFAQIPYWPHNMDFTKQSQVETAELNLSTSSKESGGINLLGFAQIGGV